MSKKIEKATNQVPKMKKSTPNSGTKNTTEDNRGNKSSSQIKLNSGQAKVEEGEVKKIPLFELKPYMRTPKLLLNNYCQKEKRPKPIYNKLNASKGMFRYVVILNDPKGKEENSLRFETKESFINNDLAQHYAAMLALRHLEGSRPLYKLFPAPLDEAWLSMDTSNPLVSRSNEFVSQKEKTIFESEKIRKQAEKKNKIDITGQKQKLEIPTLSMSYNIRRRTIGIINNHFPMLSKSYSFKSWLFDNCNTFSGFPRSLSKPKLVSMNLEQMNSLMRENYSSFLKSNGLNVKMVLLSLKYWHGIDNKDKEGIIKLVESCGFDAERSLTALNVVIKEIEEYNKSSKNLCKLQKRVYMDYFRISNICIVTDIDITTYPKHYIAWLCIMWLSIHLKENDLPQLISPKKAQIEVKDYSNSKGLSKNEESDLINESVKNLLTLSLEDNSKKDQVVEEISKNHPTKPLQSCIIFKACRYEHLSASKNSEQIIEKLKSNQILIVKGETGCGKTTQIPISVYEGITQFTEGMIYCSEPRRLAAVSVSTRVRNEIIKENKHIMKDLVGHSVRLDHSVTINTRLVYCTHGILINIIKSELMGISDHHSEKQFKIPINSVLILDEAHERSLDVDLLLYFMKQLAYQRSDIKLVIMSASIDVIEFVKYFNKSFNNEIGLNNNITNQKLIDYSHQESVFQIDTINLPGKTPFPIDVSYLPLKQKKHQKNHSQDENDNDNDDDQELSNLENNICKPLDIPKLKDHVLGIIKSLGNQEGSVLIFLGGIGDVNHLTKLLKKEFEENEQDQEAYQDFKEKVELPIPLHVLACHSNVNYYDQLEIFKPVKGKRKVIVSTNIAEVSLTIEDIRFVIDTGRVRISIFDPIRHITSLQEVLISKSSAQQRMGRAGRTAPGKCFRIFTEEELQSQPLEITPEILRLPIEHIILDILCYLGDFSSSDKDLNLGKSRELQNSLKLIQLIHSLQDFFTPPKLSSIETSLLSLRNYGALDDQFKITPLGELLSRWPVDLSIGILFIYGLIFDCIDPIVTIASFLTCEIPWKLEEKRLPKSSTNCDYMIFIKVYNFYVQHFKSVSKYETRKLNNILENIENHRLPFDPKCLDISKMETIYQTKKHLLRVLSIQETTEKMMDEAQIFSKWNLIQTCIAASLYPNVACIRLPKRIKYVESGSGLFAETIQFNKLLLYRKNRLSKKPIGHFLNPQPKEKPISISQAYDLVKESEDVSRVFLSESSAIYNRMYDLGTYHCIMYMSLFQSFSQKRTIIRFPISTSMYSLLMFASDSLQLNPLSLINQMKKASLHSSSTQSKKDKNPNHEILPEDSINHILIDDWILLQCPGQIQSILWYFRYVVRDFIQFLSQKLLESKSNTSFNATTHHSEFNTSFSIKETNEILELLHFLI